MSGPAAATSALAVWRQPCAGVGGISPADPVAQQQFFEANFTPYRLAGSDGSTTGLVTGYYEAFLLGSRKRTARFKYPIYGPPADLVAVDLGDVSPDIKDRVNKRWKEFGLE